MLRNYYITAIRNLIKHKSYFFLNMAGLAIGITSFIFISLYVINELSYDRFHDNYENTYRIHVRGQLMGQTLDQAVTAAPMALALLNDFPEVAQVTRVKESGAWLIGQGQKKFNEDGVLFADSTFFEVFDFEFLSGDPKTALVKPRSMVLTESFARKYFGKEEAFGKRITVEEDTIFYEVTGVIKDVPDNSHIKFDMLGSRCTYKFWDNNFWVSHNEYTYVVLNENADPEAFEGKLRELVVKYVGPQVEQFLGTTMEAWESAGNSFGYYLMPIRDIHLHSNVDEELEANSDISYVYIYSLIALVLLSIAIINFVNLATAQSAARSKEVGIRKVMGSTRKTLIYQFIFESVIVAFIATVLSVLLVSLLSNQFESLINKELAITLFSSKLSIAILLLLAVFIGVASGFYPAFILAGFRPSEVLKGKLRAGSKSGILRNMLVVIQFTASIVIIIGTIVVYNQIDFMLSKNLGFDKEQIVVIRRPDMLDQNLETFKNDLLENSKVKSVANATSIPGKDRFNNNAYMTEDSPDSPYLLMESSVSFGYPELLGLELSSGRFFSREYASDSNSVVINETAARTIGYTPEEAIGKNFINKNDDGSIQKLPIIGVTKDYNIHSLHRAMEPTMMRIMRGNWEGFLLVKLTDTRDVRETVSFVEETWFKYSHNKPFQYFFFDDDYANLYISESTTGNVFMVFAGLSIAIACLGLIGLITYTTSVRKKEIGIRKVLGAGTGSLVRLLSGEFVRLMVISTLISWPVAYFASDYWLQNFAERLSISFWFFVLSTFLVAFIGAIAISFQTVKTSLSNPVDSLRAE